jgi:ATP-dependent exoDNAse (exonuclease V) beta subunit
MKEYLLERLKCFKDDDFKFDPIRHKYTYRGDNFISVTTFIQQFHKPFEQDYWSKKKAEETGVTQEFILNQWKKLNDYANEVGSETHEWIEDYFNQKWRKLPTNLDVINRINKFNIIYAEKLHKLEPLAYEVRIFSKKWRIAGMIDALFLYKDKIYILDWKSNKRFDTDETLKYKEPLLAPFDDYYNSHLSEYSIQISLYSLILEEFGFEVAGGYLVHIGPGDDPARLYKVIDMRDKLRIFLGDRK